MQARQQLASVQLERPFRLPEFERRREAPHIGPYGLLAHFQLLFAPSEHDLVTQRFSQRVQCLSECVAGMRVVELGPEQRKQTIASVKTERSSGGEVAKERDQLGSPEDGTERSSLGVSEIQSPEAVEPDHSADLACARPVSCRLTRSKLWVNGCHPP